MKEFKSIIKTAHEESYSDGRTIGVLTNYRVFGDNDIVRKYDSHIYFFRESDGVGMYIFFETIMEMNDYLLYGSKKVKRAYMKEDMFDDLFDNGVEGEFGDHLKWTE